MKIRKSQTKKFYNIGPRGENPTGNWTLEIHNDAAVHWGYEAKFYTWTLQLFGTEFDPNSEPEVDGTGSDGEIDETGKVETEMPESKITERSDDTIFKVLAGNPFEGEGSVQLTSLYSLV
jgi:subtilisin-like proprotein convertase family protein